MLINPPPIAKEAPFKMAIFPFTLMVAVPEIFNAPETKKERLPPPFGPIYKESELAFKTPPLFMVKLFAKYG